MRRMAKPPMIQKTYRVPVALYDAAMDRAEERQENLSDVIRRALEQYAAGYRCRICGNDVPHEHTSVTSARGRSSGQLWGSLKSQRRKEPHEIQQLAAAQYVGDWLRERARYIRDELGRSS